MSFQEFDQLTENQRAALWFLGHTKPVGDWFNWKEVCGGAPMKASSVATTLRALRDKGLVEDKDNASRMRRRGKLWRISIKGLAYIQRASK